MLRLAKKGSTIAAVRGALEEAGAMEYTTIVAAPASDPAGFKYLAPFTGSAIGQHWMYAGDHVLIVFDDLSSKQMLIVQYRCCFDVHRAVKRIQEMSFIYTHVY